MKYFYKNCNKIPYLICIIAFISCLKEKENEILKINENGTIVSQDPSNKILVEGTSDDKDALEYFNIINHAYLFGKEYEVLKKKISNDTMQIVLDSFFGNQMLDIKIMGKKYYEGQIFARPGDTIVFKIKNGILKFTGKNKVENNFYTLLNDSTAQYSKNPYKGNIFQYKRTVEAIYEEKKIFLKKYIHEHNVKSHNFIKIVTADLKYEYLNNLINPRNVKASGSELYFNEQDGLIPIIQKESFSENKLFDIANYVDNVTIEDFKSEKLLNSSFFLKDDINAFIRHYFLSSQYLDYSKEKLFAEKKFIENNLNGKLKTYAIAPMISDYDHKGFGYSTGNIETLKSIMDEYDEQFTESSYKERMVEIRASLNSFDFKLSDAALNTKLLSKYGDTLTLKEIFDRSTKRIRVIDFWASWCPPCITEITKAKAFKDKLAVTKNVEWIYLSIDEDERKWLKKSKELSEFLNVSNQYLILHGKNSSLASSLKVNGIPRFVIFDKQNKIVLDNAPRPSDSIVFEKVINNISSDKNR